MSRYIDADKVLEIVRCEYYNDFARSIADLTSLEELLADTPTANVKPAVRGEWVLYERAHYYKCSKCRGIVPYKKGVKKYDNGLPEYICCPHCGADMTGEDDG